MNISEYAPEMQGVQPNKDMIAEGLELIGYPILITALLPDTDEVEGKHFTQRQAIEAVDWAFARNDAGFNVYWQTNIVKPDARDPWGRPIRKASKRDIMAARFGLAGTVRRLKGARLAVAEAYRLAAVARGDSKLSEGVPRGEWREAFRAGKDNPDSARTVWGREIGKLCDDLPSTDEGLCFLKPAIADSLRSK